MNHRPSPKRRSSSCPTGTFGPRVWTRPALANPPISRRARTVIRRGIWCSDMLSERATPGFIPSLTVFHRGSSLCLPIGFYRTAGLSLQPRYTSPPASPALGCTIPAVCSLDALFSVALPSPFDNHFPLGVQCARCPPRFISRLVVSTLPYYPIAFSCIKPPLRSKLVAQFSSRLTLAIL